MLAFCYSLEDNEARTITPKSSSRSLVGKFDKAEFGEDIERRGKRDLTPSSKMAILPQAKCFEVGSQTNSMKALLFVNRTDDFLSSSDFVDWSRKILKAPPS